MGVGKAILAPLFRSVSIRPPFLFFFSLPIQTFGLAPLVDILMVLHSNWWVDF